MFTGIISALGTVRRIDPIGAGRDMRLVIGTPEAFLATPLVELGASIACSGCCLTVVESGPGWFAVDASAETLAHTKLGTWTIGSAVNLERSLRMGDEIGGHIVTGHVDAVGDVVGVSPEGDSRRIGISVSKALGPMIAQKGSIALDGVSMTVNEVRDAEDGSTHFSVNVIPHTAQHTTLGELEPGKQLNVEVDVLARYIDRMLAQRSQ
jgi:riboflavin synthase